MEWSDNPQWHNAIPYPDKPRMWKMKHEYLQDHPSISEVAEPDKMAKHRFWRKLMESDGDPEDS